MAKSISQTRTNDPVGMRKRVIETAATLFQNQGYNATSVVNVLNASGVSPGALHHHFPTKKALIEAVLQESVAQELDQTWAQSVRDAPDAITGIAGVFSSVADALDAAGAVSGCPLGNIALELSLSDEGLRSLVAVEYRKWRKAIVDKLGGDRNTAAEDEAFATTVVALFTGAMSLAKVEQAGAPLRACASQIQNLRLRY